MLLTHEEKQDKEENTLGSFGRKVVMFAQPTGQPLDPRADYQEWRGLLNAANVRPARLHDARHTATTMLLVLKGRS